MAGVYSHDEGSTVYPAVVPRPPGVESRNCSKHRCSRPALWTVPEEPWCSSHIPLRLYAVANERRQMWATLGAEMWEDIVASVPILPDGTEGPE